MNLLDCCITFMIYHLNIMKTGCSDISLKLESEETCEPFKPCTSLLLLCYFVCWTINVQESVWSDHIHWKYNLSTFEELHVSLPFLQIHYFFMCCSKDDWHFVRNMSQGVQSNISGLDFITAAILLIACWLLKNGAVNSHPECPRLKDTTE